MLFLLDAFNFFADFLYNLRILNNFLFPFSYRNNIENLTSIFGSKFFVCLFLKFQFIDNLRNIGITSRFNLQSDIFFFYLNEKVNIITPVPFIWSWLYFNIQFLLELAINCLNFGLVTIISSVNNQIDNKINTVLFGYAFYFCCTNFRYFYIKSSA